MKATAVDLTTYVEDVNNLSGKYPEVRLELKTYFLKLDLMLISLMLEFDIEILYLSHEGISSFQIQLPSAPEKSDKTIRFMLDKDGFYDAVFSKSFIKTAGICQSMLFEVRKLI